MSGVAAIIWLASTLLAACTQVPMAEQPTPVALPTRSSLLKARLYYYNQEADRKNGTVAGSPKAVLPVEREVPVTVDPIRDTSRLLLQGNLTEEERRAGFSTEFPGRGFALEIARLQGGTLTLQFADPNYFTSGGSCRVTLLRAQVEKTAGQIAGVSAVRMVPDTLFQP
jgi:hypothetical protein